MALQLRRRGITRVRPLEGGLEQWMSLGFPVRPLEASEMPPSATSAASEASPEG